VSRRARLAVAALLAGVFGVVVVVRAREDEEDDSRRSRRQERAVANGIRPVTGSVTKLLDDDTP
jgi:hypothetical protein